MNARTFAAARQRTEKTKNLFRLKGEKPSAAGKTFFLASDSQINAKALEIALEAARVDPLWSATQLNKTIDTWVKIIDN